MFAAAGCKRISFCLHCRSWWTTSQDQSSYCATHTQNHRYVSKTRHDVFTLTEQRKNFLKPWKSLNFHHHHQTDLTFTVSRGSDISSQELIPSFFATTIRPGYVLKMDISMKSEKSREMLHVQIVIDQNVKSIYCWNAANFSVCNTFTTSHGRIDINFDIKIKNVPGLIVTVQPPAWQRWKQNLMFVATAAVELAHWPGRTRRPSPCGTVTFPLPPTTHFCHNHELLHSNV